MGLILMFAFIQKFMTGATSRKMKEFKEYECDNCGVIFESQRRKGFCKKCLEEIEEELFIW